MSNQPAQKPEIEFRAGNITAAVWRHERDRDGETVVSWSVKLQKRYYDKDVKAYQDTDYLFPEDLPRATLVLQEAYRYIMLRERDPNAPVDTQTVEQVA
jgi:hypothetical protein